MTDFIYKQMTKNLLAACIFLCLTFTANSNIFFQSPPIIGRQVNLMSDNGKYLARCFGCGQNTGNSAGVHVTNPSEPWAIWTVQVVGSKIALRGDNNKYLSRCFNCWPYGSTFLDPVFVHVPILEHNPWSLWTPQRLENGKWAFKSDSGRYLARCSGCVIGGAVQDFAFVYAESNNDAWAQWTVTEHIPPIIGRQVNLMSDNGKYLARCFGCGQNTGNSAGVHVTNPSEPWAKWTVQVVGQKIALRGDNNKYLSRCFNCWSQGSTFLDAVFVHVPILENNPWSLWTPQRLANGKWVFKSDNGRYLARCSGCVIGGAFQDFAFAYSESQNDAWAQWTVTENRPQI